MTFATLPTMYPVSLGPLRKLLSRTAGKDPDKYVGGVIPNLLGLQVARALLLNGLHALRPAPAASGVEHYVATLKRDGIVIIPDFAGEETFGKIQRAFADLSKTFDYRPCISEGLRSPTADAGHAKMNYATSRKTSAGEAGKEFFKLIEERVGGDKRLANIIRTVLKRDPRFAPWEVFVHTWNNGEYPEFDSASFYHADTFHPEYKGYFYLEDVSRDNGAFTYAKGSHRMTLRRLAWEYLKSIRFARMKGRTKEEYQSPDGRAPHNLSIEDEKFLRIKGEPIEGKAGTLIIFKTSGVHRRGDFKPGTRRAVTAFSCY